MDSFDLRNQKYKDAIIESMMSGAISPEEIDARLTALIETEIAKSDTDIDVDLVRACEDLLWALHAQETAHLENHKKRQFAVLQEHMDRKAAKIRTPRKIARITLVAAAILVLFVVGDVALERQWLVSHQSDDEQQLVLQGQAIESGLLNTSVAEIGELASELRTTDLHALSEFLGFTPALPTYIPAGWELHSYHAAKLPNETLVSAAFLNDDTPKMLAYEVTRYSSARLVQAQIEQNRSGDRIILGDGTEVYVTENINDTTCVWINGMDSYFLSAPLALDTMKEIAESIH